MEEKIVCYFCEKMYKKSGINRYVKTHAKKLIETEKPGKSYFLSVVTKQRYSKTPYFLYLWVDGKTKVQELNDYLRAIWLECFGHLSSFVEVSTRNNFNFSFNFDENYSSEISKKKNNTQYIY